MKISNDTIGNRTRDLPACSAVPQPQLLHRVPYPLFRFRVKNPGLFNFVWWCRVCVIYRAESFLRSQYRNFPNLCNTKVHYYNSSPLVRILSQRISPSSRSCEMFRDFVKLHIRSVSCIRYVRCNEYAILHYDEICKIRQISKIAKYF